MSSTPIILPEPDHLTRIHLKLGLENVGFVVCEEDDAIFIGTDPGDYVQFGSRQAKPVREPG